MRFVALISGGKDSWYSAMLAVSQGHELVALANLAPPSPSSLDMDSWMYQTVGHEAVEAFAACAGLPLFRARTRGCARETRLAYREARGDEVEDLYELLELVKRSVPGAPVAAVSSGALASDYQRTRVERVAARLGLVSLSYMWHQPQGELLDAMLAAGVDARLVKVAAAGLTRDDLGRSLATLRPKLNRLCRLYGSSVCGEGGEYETLVLDCPLFARGRLEILESHVEEEDEGNADMGRVARLKIDRYRVVAKRKGNEGADADGTVVLPPGQVVWLERRERGEGGLAPEGAAAGNDPERARDAGGRAAEGAQGGARDSTGKAAEGAPKGAPEGAALDASADGSPSPLPPAPKPLPLPFSLSSGVWETADGSVAAWAAVEDDGAAAGAVAPPSAPTGLAPPAITSPPSTLAALSAPSAFSSSVAPPPKPLDTALAVEHLLAAVRRRLASRSLTYEQAVAVRLFVPSMASFAAANAVYGAALPAAEPPTRACVEGGAGRGGRGSAAVEVLCRRVRAGGAGSAGSVGSAGRGGEEAAGGEAEAADVVRSAPPSAQRDASQEGAEDAPGSAAESASAGAPPLASRLPGWYLGARSGLHVQSVSSWAPACIGPYAQAARGPPGLVFYAGQIALDPASMAIVPGGGLAELERCWTSCRAVSVALGAPFDDALLFMTVHVADALQKRERDDVIARVLRKLKARAGEGGADEGGEDAPTSPSSASSPSSPASSASSINPFTFSPAHDALDGSTAIPPDDYLVAPPAPKRRYDVPVLFLSQPQLPKSALVELEPVLWDGAEPSPPSGSGSEAAEPLWRSKLRRSNRDEVTVSADEADGADVRSPPASPLSPPLGALRASVVSSPGRLVRATVGVRRVAAPGDAARSSRLALRLLTRAFALAAADVAAAGLDPLADVGAARAYVSPLAAALPGLGDPRLVRRAAKLAGLGGVSLVVPVGGAWVEGERVGEAIAIEVVATRAGGEGAEEVA